ncbi:MAG: hypothetical protein AAF960_17185 [Bacteroidota bacterium]
MNTLELKGSLLQLIANLKDEKLLAELYKTLISHYQNQDNDWWENLQKAQQDELSIAIEESYDPTNLHSDKNARKQIAQWLQK